MRAKRGTKLNRVAPRSGSTAALKGPVRLEPPTIYAGLGTATMGADRWSVDGTQGLRGQWNRVRRFRTLFKLSFSSNVDAVVAYALA